MEDDLEWEPFHSRWENMFLFYFHMLFFIYLLTLANRLQGKN